jgi:dynein light chain 1
LRHLKIRSLGRNQIKKISGLEDIGDHLEELWISYNLIENLIGLAPHCTALKVLYIAHNKIRDINELDRIKDLPSLTNCVFLGNDVYDKFPTKEDARLQVLGKLK